MFVLYCSKISDQLYFVGYRRQEVDSLTEKPYELRLYLLLRSMDYR